MDADGDEAAVVKGNVESATVLEPYPADRYELVRDGKMSTAEFITDLIRHVSNGLDRAAPTA